MTLIVTTKKYNLKTKSDFENAFYNSIALHYALLQKGETSGNGWETNGNKR